MPRALTAPPTDRTMWRRLLRCVHPDTGGDHELFVWADALREYVAGDAVEPPPPRAQREPPKHHSTGERVDFTAAFDKAPTFADLTAQAVAMAGEMGQPYARLLRLLADCQEAPASDAVLHRQQAQGATFKQLAYIGHLAGMSTSERMEWYRIAADVPLAQRHAGHVIARLQAGVF